MEVLKANLMAELLREGKAGSNTFHFLAFALGTKGTQV